jgi:hypothetical protein
LVFRIAFSSFSDLVLALYPLTFIWNLQVNLRVRFGLAIIMGLGIIATIASIFKTVELKNLATRDFTWNATNLVYWYITENWIIVIAACVPTLKPLDQKISDGGRFGDGRGKGEGSGRSVFRSWFGSKGTSSGSSTGQFSRSGKESGGSVDLVVHHETTSTGNEGIMVKRDVDIV